MSGSKKAPTGIFFSLKQFFNVQLFFFINSRIYHLYSFP